MKAILIPKNNNPFIVVINNQVYSYPAGKTVEVPDEVAEIIQREIDAHANTAAPQLVQPRWGKRINAVDGEDEYEVIPYEYTPILVVNMKYSHTNGNKEYYVCDTPYDEIVAAVGKKAIIAWYGGTQALAKKTGDIISFTGLVRSGESQHEWYYST